MASWQIEEVGSLMLENLSTVRVPGVGVAVAGVGVAVVGVLVSVAGVGVPVAEK